MKSCATERECNYEYSYETLLDIITAQNQMIEELIARVDELETTAKKKHTPAVVKDGVLLQLERFVI